MSGLELVLLISICINVYLFADKNMYKTKAEFWEEEWKRAMDKWSQDIDRSYRKG